MTNVDKRQKDSDRPWQLSAERTGAGLRLGLFPANGIIYKLNLRIVFTATGRFDVYSYSGRDRQHLFLFSATSLE